MKFLLVMPRFIDKTHPNYLMPLGLPYISATLKAAGHQVRCVNLNHIGGDPRALVEAAVRDFDPDVCGSGCLSPQMPLVQEIFKHARKAKPGIVNVVGGGVLSSAPELAMEIMDIDIGVIGEGEIAILEISDALEKGEALDGIADIVFRGPDGKVRRTGKRTANKDIDTLPWPDFDSFMGAEYVEGLSTTDFNFYNSEDKPRCVPMVSSRSCPFACTFCFHPSGRVYRNRGFDDFFAELESLIAKYDINMIMILDELFAVKKSRLMEFCERIKDYGVKWCAQLHVGVIDEEVIDALKGANCTQISYGVESINDDILVSMQKKTTKAKIESALALTYDKQIEIQGNLIFGDSAETMETANYTLNWWAHHQDYHINLSYVQVYHGSPIYHEAMKKGLIKDDAAHYRNPALNITVLDQDTYARMHRRLAVFTESIFQPTKILNFEKTSARDPMRGPLYRVEWQCPRCARQNDFAEVPYEIPQYYQKMCLTCRDCQGRFEVRNLARPPSRHAELEALYEQAVQSRQGGDLNRAAALYQQILTHHDCAGSMAKPDVYPLAAFDLGNIFLESGRSAEIAVHYLSEAVFQQAYNPVYHLSYGRALMDEGSLGAAALHFRQAAMLAADGNPEIAGLAETMRRRCVESGDDAALRRYFV